MQGIKTTFLAVCTLAASYATSLTAAAPVITSQPNAATVISGTNVTFRVGMQGATTLPAVGSGNLKLWLKADSGVILQSNRVSQWQDQSGGNHHSFQADTNKQPSLVSGALSGQPVVRFDGVQNTVTGDFLHGTDDLGLAGSYTSFLVYSKVERGGTATEEPALVGTPGTNDLVRGYYFLGNQMALAGWTDDSYSGIYVTPSTYRIWTQRLITNTTPVAQADFFDSNGTNEVTASKPHGGLLPPGAGYYVGGLDTYTRNFQGDIAELIYYQGDLSENDRQAVASYLKQRYFSVGVNIPGLTYQWQFNGTNILNATNASLTLTNVQAADVGDYSVIVSSDTDSVTSSNASLSLVAPVTIGTQPASQTVGVGTNVLFTVSASGSGTLAYQWRFNGTNLVGKTNSSLAIGSVQLTNAGNYSVKVSNAVSSVTSSNASLVVLVLPVITAQPQNASVATGSNATFSVGVSAATNGNFGYQWQFNGANIVRATNSALTLTNVQSTNVGSYSVTVSNVLSTVTSSNASLVVIDPVTIGAQPASQTVVVGTNVLFTVSASGGGTLAYQWKFNGANLVGETTSSLAIGSVQLTNAGNYSVKISNAVSSVTSSSASLVVLTTPVITAQPQDTSVVAGGDVSFGVGVSGALPSVSSGNLKLWLKADSGVVLQSNRVSQWQDQSGGNHHSFQTDTNKQPSLVTGVLNGQPVVRFDGVQDTITGDYLHGTDDLGLAGSYTSFLVYSKVERGGTIAEEPALVGTPGTNDLVRGYYFLGNQMALAGWTDDSYSGLYVTPSTYRIWTQRLITNNTSVAQADFFDSNGTNEVTASKPHGGLLPPGAGYYVGGLDTYTRNFQGDIAELIYYQGNLSENDRQLVSNYLKQKYFQSGAVGNGNVSYQWQFNGTDIVGATNGTLTLTDVQPNGAGYYSVTVSNVAGVVTSSNALLTVNLPPSIDTQPQSQSANAGSVATFSVAVSGTGPISYLWQKNSNNIVGATNASLVLTNLQPSDAAGYRVVVTSPWGSVTSSSADLTVNISTLRAVNLDVSSATTITLPIQLAAIGTENAMGFSLSFDPAIFSYNGISLGSGLSQATLISNTNQVGSGKLGVAIALPANTTFVAGTQQVVQVSFKVAPVTNAQTSAISFGDVPTVRQISDVAAHGIASVFVNGTISISAVDFEGDVSPRPSGDRVLSITDWVQVGRFVAGLDTISSAQEFQRVDCAPRSNGGNGSISVTDWVQAGRYAAGVDPLTPASGPTGGFALAKVKPLSFDPDRVIEIKSDIQNGRTNVVSVDLVAVGNENAIGFSISYDPAKLTFVSASLGNGASGAFLNVNTNDASAGSLGFAVALSTGNTFAAGTQQVVKLTFVAAPSNGGTAELSFSDAPVLREISDSGANSLGASYTDASLPLADMTPSLTVTNTTNGLLLSWPVSASGFTLEAGNSFTNWTTVTNDLSTNGDAITTTIPLSEDQKFYRLKK